LKLALPPTGQVSFSSKIKGLYEKQFSYRIDDRFTYYAHYWNCRLDQNDMGVDDNGF